MSVLTPTISLQDNGSNSYSVIISLNTQSGDTTRIKSYSIYNKTNNIQLYKKSSISSNYEFYTWYSTSSCDIEVSVVCSNSSEESATTTKTFHISFNPDIGKANNFEYSVDENGRFNYSFDVPEELEIAGYSIECATSNSLNVNSAQWESFVDEGRWVDWDSSDRTISDEGSYNISSFYLDDCYILLKVSLRDAVGTTYPGMCYGVIPKKVMYNTKIVTPTENKNCGTKVFIDGQWRQCVLHYYTLHPLVSSILDEQLVTIDGRPLFVAEKATIKQPSLVPKYQQVEYIESTGSQWIDSGFVPNQDTRVVLDWKYVELITGNNYLFGVRQNGTSNLYSLNLTNELVVSGYGTRLNAVGELDTNRHIVDKNKDTVYVGDNGGSLQYASTFTCPGTISIFACNYVGNDNQGYQSSKYKLYSMQIYDNDVLVRDFIPCYRISDNEIGLYDKVNKVFYTNSGTGSFEKGEDVLSQGQIYE